MLKRGLVVVVVVMSCFMLSALAHAEVVLKFWDMVWGPEPYNDTARSIVEEFNRTHPDIKVEYEIIPWQGFYERFVTAVTAGEAPDISTGSTAMPVQMAAMGAALPIDDLLEELKKSGEYEDFIEGTWERYFYEGHYYGWPWQIDPRVIYYRSDMLEEVGTQPPTNWDELIQVGQKLAKPEEDVWGFAFSAIPGQYDPPQYFLSFLFQNGGSVLDENGNLVFNSKATRETLQFIYDLVYKYKIMSPKVTSLLGDDIAKLFARRKVGIFYTVDNSWTIMQREVPESLQFTKVGEIFTGPAGIRKTNGYINAVQLYNQTRHPEEAKLFLKWWMKPENQIILFRTGTCHFPPRKSMLNDPEFIKNFGFADIAQKALPYVAGMEWPYPSISLEMVRIEGELILSRCLGWVLTGEKTVEEAVMDATKEMERIFQEAGKM